MSNYTQTNNFTALTTAQAIINGAAFDTEYGNISTAIASKYDSTTTALTLSSLLVGSATGQLSTLGIVVGSTSATNPGMVVVTSSSGVAYYGANNATSTALPFSLSFNFASRSTYITSNSLVALSITNTGQVQTNYGLYVQGNAIVTAYAGYALQVAGVSGTASIEILSGSAQTPILNAQGGGFSTGAQTATFSATNKPGTATTGPTQWLYIQLSGTNYYIPCWQ